MPKQMIDIDLHLTVEKFDTYEKAMKFREGICPNYVVYGCKKSATVSKWWLCRYPTAKNADFYLVLPCGLPEVFELK